MTKSRLYIYIIAGGYVAYTGLGLAKSAVSQKPDNYMMYLAIGILFIALGGFFVIKSFLKLSRGDYADAADNTEDSGIKDLDEDFGSEEKQEGRTDDENRNGV